MADPVTLHAACGPGEIRVAAWDGTLRDYALWRPGLPDGVGDVYRGRVVAVAKPLGGRFVALDGGATGFLPDTAHAQRLGDGSPVTVRVIRAAQGGKGPRLACAEGEGAGPPGLIRRGPGALERLAAAYPQAAIMIDDPAVIALLPQWVKPRCRIVARVFAAAIEDEVAQLHGPIVALRGGGRMTIEPTAALTAIDLDAGGGLAGSAKAAAHLAFNRAAIAPLARQIRLRNLSGVLLVDCAGLAPRQRPALAEAFRAALAEDPAGARLVGFTGLGLAEIVRTRTHPPLHELMMGPHAAACAAARAAVAADAGRPEGVVLHAAPDVVAAVQQDAVLREGLARSAARALMLHSDPALPPGTWHLAAPARTKA